MSAKIKIQERHGLFGCFSTRRRATATFLADTLTAICPILWSGAFLLSSPAQAESVDPDIVALRREVAEMRSELRKMRRAIGSAHPAVPADHGGNSSLASAVTHSHDWNGVPEPGIRFVAAKATPVFAGPPVIRRTPPDSGIVSSWKDFRAATARSEVVQVGGLRVGFPNGRPTIATEDGRYAFSTGLGFQEDFGGYLGMASRGGEPKGRFPGFTENARRMRLFLTFRYKDWVANVTPDFGSGTADGKVGLYEANLNYAGLRNTELTVGYYEPRESEESAERSGGLTLLERPSIIDIVRNIAANAWRFSVGGLHYEKQWFVSAWFTGQQYGDRNIDTTISDSQTGVVARAVGRPYVSRDIDVMVGVGTSDSFKRNESASGRVFRMSPPTGNVPLSQDHLLTASIPNASSVWSVGPELAVRWKRLLVKGEYFHIGVNRSPLAGLAQPSLGFDGWYVTASYTLFGHARAFDVKRASFLPPGVTEDFDPFQNHWGAMELSVRWDETNLNDHPGTLTGFRGGRSTTWESALNWYLNQHFRLALDYSHFSVSRNSQSFNILGRSGNALAGRVQAAF
ncbi:OprO/OprP family phosphate-selective porin [Acetobacter sp.]|jgi:phosphate-selective porin OprO/OprP|uniref:OprO/OprP family phosphate-selective porin n=1 Tax=Acetobacter sp. TaxID=440 RepID=UPI0025BF15B2|nr:porin [Acetobacter sp.]MCH4090319.1 porin [Acetobacter sp.]MCI1299013.1 porin [Acetobacter sp.]MCI1315033.1 porin [Acetobacter sp.]